MFTKLDPPDFKPTPDLFPFDSRWFESSVGAIHYVDEGRGRPILFLHGNPTWSFLYRMVISRLRDTFRCIAPDYPGFGLSVRPGGYGYTAEEHADVVQEFVSALGVDDIVVFGHDWGGPIGMSVASSEPDRISGIVLSNTWFWPTDRLQNVLFGRLMSSPPMRWAILSRNLFVERLIPAGTARKLSREEMDHYRGVQPWKAYRIGIAEFPRQLNAAASWLISVHERSKNRLAGKPALLVWGMRDIAFPPGDFVPRIRGVFDISGVVELENAKHYTPEDEPNEIADAIRAYFR